METKFKLVTVFVLMFFVLSINAQEQKKIKIKMIKDINGKTTVVDTIIIGTDFKDIDFSGFHVTSDMEEIISELESGEKKESKMKFYFTDDEKSGKCDSLKHIWIEVSDELDSTAKDAGYAYFITSDGEEVTSTDKKVVFISGNSADKIKMDTVFESGSKKVIIKSSGDKDGDDVMVWVSASDDVTELNDSIKGIKVKNVITKSGDNEEITIYVTTDEENDHSAKEKSYEVIVKSGDNGEYKTVVMDGKKGEFYSNDDVIIIKSKNDSENIIMMIKDITDEDKRIISEINKDIKPENELKDIILKIMYKAKDRNASLEFEVKNKSNVKVNIFDKTGKSSFSDEQKGFSGIYNKKIDLTEGEYFIQISIDKKTSTKKLTIK